MALFSEMSRATEITTSRRGDVTNASDMINNPSFVLCSCQIIEPGVAVSFNALDFTVCYDLTKLHLNCADCLNTEMLLLSRIKDGYDSSAIAMYFERFCWIRLPQCLPGHICAASPRVTWDWECQTLSSGLPLLSDTPGPSTFWRIVSVKEIKQIQSNDPYESLIEKREAASFHEENS